MKSDSALPNNPAELLAGLRLPNSVFAPTLALADEGRHYCLTRLEPDDPEAMVRVIDHPLDYSTEITADPMIIYGVFRCPICLDWWGNWLWRDIENDVSDWYRFGPDEPTTRHRGIDDSSST